MSGSDARQRLLGSAGSRVHLLVPFVRSEPLGVQNLDRDRRTECSTVADSAHQRDLVDLETLTRTPSVPEPASREFGLDVGCRHRETRREPFDNDDQCLAVGLSSGQEAQHCRQANARSTSVAARFMASASGRRPVQISCWRAA